MLIARSDELWTKTCTGCPFSLHLQSALDISFSDNGTDVIPGKGDSVFCLTIKISLMEGKRRVPIETYFSYL